MYNYIQIKNRKSKINSYEKSERKVIFMLRGLARSYKGWLGFEEDLSDKYDIICIDLPGVGLSKNEKHLYSIKDMAEKITEVINYINPESFYIIAPSLGSLVTYEIIKKFSPSRIKGLIIIVPSHSGFGINRLTPKALKTITSSSFVSKEVKLAMLKNMLIGKTEDERDAFEDIHLERKWKNQILQDLEELGTKGQLSQITAAAKYTSKSGLNYIRDNKIPIKVLVSGADMMIPVKHEKIIYEYLKHDNSELIEMKNAGHDFIVTHKDFLEKVVDNFINNTENKKNNSVIEKIPVKVNEQKNKKENKNGILFFASTVIAGTLLLLASKKYKDKK